MKRVMRLLAWTAASSLACAAPALADSPAAFAPLAHSALVTVEGVVASDTLLLRVRRTADQQPLPGAELTVAVGGRSIPVTARTEGSWALPLKDLPKPPGKLAITVAHDGVREVLDGQLPGGGATAPPGSQSGSVASTLIHKQMAWWILNVVIVLVGVIAVSRRMS